MKDRLPVIAKIIFLISFIPALYTIATPLLVIIGLDLLFVLFEVDFSFSASDFYNLIGETGRNDGMLIPMIAGIVFQMSFVVYKSMKHEKIEENKLIKVILIFCGIFEAAAVILTIANVSV